MWRILQSFIFSAVNCHMLWQITLVCEGFITNFVLIFLFSTVNNCSENQWRNIVPLVDLVFWQKASIYGNPAHVYTISTCHAAQMVTYTNKRGQQTQKPLAVEDYNCHKAGLHLMDQYWHMDHSITGPWSGGGSWLFIL